MKILFVDDEHERRKIFIIKHPTDIVHFAESAPNAINVLDCEFDGAEPFDEIHLDHDLGYIYNESAKGYDGTYTARIIHSIKPFVKHLIEERADRTTLLFIHSHNTVEAEKMTIDLSKAGYSVARKPFGA